MLVANLTAHTLTHASTMATWLFRTRPWLEPDFAMETDGNRRQRRGLRTIRHVGMVDRRDD